MPPNTLKKHPLVRVDLTEAFAWYEGQRKLLGFEFAAEFKVALQKIKRDPLLYAIRFSQIRRANLHRFPYGIFYLAEDNFIIVPAVFHASRDTEEELARRRTHFKQP